MNLTRAAAGRFMAVMVVLLAGLLWACGRGGADAAQRAAQPAVSGHPQAAEPEEPPVERTFLFGTLLSDHRRAAGLHESGVRVVHLELAWDRYEPVEGRFDDRYAAEMRERLWQMKDAGMQVVLGVGLQYPPPWAFRYPNSRYRNQDSVEADALNLTFNRELRERAERYVARVHRDLGLQHFMAVRVGSGGLIEVLYPPARFGESRNSYWAFDANAQGSLAARESSSLPDSVPPSPFPGWAPGERTYRGEPFSLAQVERWYDWYLRAMVDGVNWQIELYRRLGFKGDIHVVMPGVGARPREYAAAIESYLEGSTSHSDTVSRAAVWDRVIGSLVHYENVVVYVSSMADGSGGDDVCRPGDETVALTDPAVERWSATRWLAYNAGRFGLEKNGENPGRRHTRRYGTGMMEAAARQMRACGFQGMMWAHEFELFDPESGVTLEDYVAVITEYAQG